MQYEQIPVRLQATAASNPGVTPIDQNTGLPIAFWRAQNIVINFAAFDVTGACVDFSNINRAVLTVQDAQNSLAPILVKTVTGGSITPTIAKSDWDAGLAQQIQFLLSAAETDLSLAGMSSQTFWISIVLTTANGANLVYVAGNVTVLDPGLPPVQPANPYVSRHAQVNGGGASAVVPTSQIHTEVVTVTGGAGTRQVVVQAAGLVAGAHVALRLVLPNTAGIAIQIFDQSANGTLLATVNTTGDGFTPVARVELEFDGANWNRDFLIIPAFGQQN